MKHQPHPLNHSVLAIWPFLASFILTSKKILQTEDEPLRAVCFVPEKQSELKTLEKIKSPVKIQNYDKGNKDVLILKNTKITPLESTGIGFSHDMYTSTSLPNLASLQKVAPEQIVAVKAQVVQLSGIMSQDTKFRGTLDKQEVIIRNTTSSTRLVIWEDSCNSLEPNKTYILENVCVKIYKKESFLNTT